MISFIIDSFVAHGWNYYRYVIKVKSWSEKKAQTWRYQYFWI